mmetsp:Transcript_72589/g.113560  ORF Transcript_72589/g.113560 Transcript_72589/m.113560 type:complete len:772 (+) Transcript_72589:124-2439(+)
MAGGAFISMIRVAGFFVLIWGASKVSRMAGISSIVLEITTGLIFSPNILGLMPKEYSECVFKLYHDCEDPHTVNHIQDHLQGCDYEAYMNKRGGVNLLPAAVDIPAESHSDAGHSSGSASHSSGSGSDHGSSLDSASASHSSASGDSHSSADQSSSHADSSDSHSSASGDSHSSSDHSSNRRLDAFAETRARTIVPNSPLAVGSRRLSADAKGRVTYPTYTECLKKACVLDVSHECQLTPNIFTFVGHAGVALMIFESGMHFDFEKAKVVGKWACVVAVLGTILPLLTGTALIVLLVPGSGLTTDGLSAGTSLAPTSVGIALKLLNEAKQLQKDFGQIIITAAFVDDILSLVLFNVLFSMADGELGFMTFLPAICGLLLMGLVIMYAATKADVHIEMMLAMMPQNPPKKKLSYQDEFLFFFMMIMVLVFGTVFFYTGTHLWGCFMAGMCLAKLHSAHHVWVKQTKRMTVWMIRIFFSCTVAFSIPVSALLSFGAIWKGALMGIGPCIATKVFCAFFMGEMRFVVGWAMVGRAEFAYLIAQMAAASNMMSEDVFAVVIWSLLWATVFAPFLFRYVLKQFVAMNEERRRQEMGDDYFPEDGEEDGHGGHDDDFRQSGHLPEIFNPDFRPEKKYDGRLIGYHYIKNGPEGTGYYKDFIAHGTKGTKDCYDWAEGGLGPGFYIKEEWKQTGEHHVPEYGKGATEVVTHEKMPSIEKAEKPVTAHMEEGNEDIVPPKMVKHDVSAPFASDADEASEVADRGSGFLCCLFFRKIVIM